MKIDVAISIRNNVIFKKIQRMTTTNEWTLQFVSNQFHFWMPITMDLFLGINFADVAVSIHEWI